MILTELLTKEVDKGYLMGPFQTSPFPCHRINPIGLVEGKYSKKKRLIVDMSAPHDNEQNQFKFINRQGLNFIDLCLSR